MELVFGPWELAQIVTKALMYAGMAGISGGMLVLGLLNHTLESTNTDNPEFHHAKYPLLVQSISLHRYMMGAAILGLLAAILFFLLQVGSIKGAGVSGMFDPVFIRVFAASSIGNGIGYKLFGFALTLSALIVLRNRIVGNTGRLMPVQLLIACLFSLFLFAISFAVLGHVAELGLLTRVTIGLHVAAVLLWTGALLPLYWLTGTRQTILMKPLLQHFGSLGWGFVACLLLAGLWVLSQILDGKPKSLFDSAYGWLMLGKLALVACLLALAALNKFRIVPTITEHNSHILQRSIFWELMLAMLILIITATLTTVTGPPHAN